MVPLVATAGPFGPDGRLDVLGHTVNVASITASNNRVSDFVIAPEAFRRLSPASRKAFHKHTPPIVYYAR